MFKFLGISYIDFTPDGGKEAIIGYRAHFVDEEMFTDPSKGVGSETFSAWFTPDKALALGIERSEDMQLLKPFLGQPVKLSFDRKGNNKVESWDIVLHGASIFPPDTSTTKPDKPNKL